MELSVKKFITGPIETNTFVLFNSDKACIIFDPSAGCDEVLEYIDEEKLALEAVCLTHAHFDHFMGLEEIVKKYVGIDIWIHPDEKKMLLDPEFNGSYMIGAELMFDGPVKDCVEGKMQIGSFEFDIYHIPGHSPGGLAYVIDEHCLSGDSLFAGSVGRTDFPGCDGPALFKNIREKLFTLPDETIVYSGHGGRTTIGREKKSNPFFV